MYICNKLPRRHGNDLEKSQDNNFLWRKKTGKGGECDQKPIQQVPLYS